MNDNGDSVLPPQMPGGFQMVKKMPISTFSIPEIGWYNPLPDLTIMELSKIVQMTIVAMLPVDRGFMFDYKLYAEQNNLLRHFSNSPNRICLKNDNCSF